MINQRRRNTLSILIAGILTTALPTSVLSASSQTRKQAKSKHLAYNGSVLLQGVDVVVSTLGVNSAITTITNHSPKLVTITRLNPSIVNHNNQHYDINAAVGVNGITLKPGGTRMLVANELTRSIA